jgi:hypothetical protein
VEVAERPLELLLVAEVVELVAVGRLTRRRHARTSSGSLVIAEAFSHPRAGASIRRPQDGSQPR